MRAVLARRDRWDQRSNSPTAGEEAETGMLSTAECRAGF